MDRLPCSVTGTSLSTDGAWVNKSIAKTTYFRLAKTENTVLRCLEFHPRMSMHIAGHGKLTNRSSSW